jgi:hypothetical protein
MREENKTNEPKSEDEEDEKKSHHSQNEMIEKLCLGRIQHNEDITINNSPKTIEDITSHCQQGFSASPQHQEIFLNYLRACVGFVGSRRFVKKLVNQRGGKRKIIEENTKDSLRREFE